MCICTECPFALYENITKDSHHKHASPTSGKLVVHLTYNSNGLILASGNQINNNNVSRCQIINLEVYRGFKSSIEINHSGFILKENNDFEVKS